MCMYYVCVYMYLCSVVSRAIFQARLLTHSLTYLPGTPGCVAHRDRWSDQVHSGAGLTLTLTLSLTRKQPYLTPAPYPLTPFRPHTDNDPDPL